MGRMPRMVKTKNEVWTLDDVRYSGQATSTALDNGSACHEQIKTDNRGDALSSDIH